jgi:uncharacterized protein
MAQVAHQPWKSALVTGASSGIGSDIAKLLGGANIPTVIVARRTDRLSSLAAEFPSLIPMAADLGTATGLSAVAERAKDVDLLVNNAGFGLNGSFLEVSADGHQSVIDLNISALVALTRAAMAPMVERRRGWILQVSSVASFQPGPSAATYSATKAFVTSLSEALHEELRGTGVVVTALCPGYTRTEFHIASGSEESASAIPNVAWLASHDVAASGLRAVAAGKALDVPGVGYKGIAALSNVLPRTAIRKVMGLASRSR